MRTNKKQTRARILNSKKTKLYQFLRLEELALHKRNFPPKWSNVRIQKFFDEGISQ